MGVEVQEPIIDDRSLSNNFANEGGAGNSFRFLKNIMGLWLVQECRREWARSGASYSYDDLTGMAAEAPPFGSLVALSDTRFLPPGGMVARIQAFCRETGQTVPETKGSIVRCALESLALEYRWVAERMDEMLGQRLSRVHIFGGGSRNRLLNQLTANATGRPVIAGPVEATAIGNILVQAQALGVVGSLDEGRALVRRSFQVRSFAPERSSAWDEAYHRYINLCDRGKIS
jgi:rhamnulokinase